MFPIQMIKRIVHAYRASLRSLWRPKLRMAVMAIASIALTAASYALFAVKEANAVQVIATMSLAVIVPMLFFVFQAMAVSYADGTQEVGEWAKQSFRVCWQLLIISALPLLIVWVLNFVLDSFWSKLVMESQADQMSGRTIPVALSEIRWQELSVVSLRYLIFGFVLPLMLIQMWIATAREGLLNASLGAGRSMIQAFSPSTVLAFFLGLVVFAVIPYVLVFTSMHVASLWGDMILLGARLFVALALALGGWILTVGAISNLQSERG